MIRTAILLASLGSIFNEQVESEIIAISENSDAETVCILGDYNSHSGERFANELLTVCAEQSWSCVDMELLPDDTFTFESTANGALRWLGHCVQTTVDPVTLLTRYQLECIEETRVNSDVIVKIKHRQWGIATKELPLVKDWALCVLMKSGIMTKQGVYKIDVAMNRVPLSAREYTEKLIDKCLVAKAIPAVDIAFQYIKCFQKLKSNQSALVSAL